MPTYREIQDQVRLQSGFVPKTCWIAHVLSDFGLTRGTAPNRHDPTDRTNPCPIHRRAAIERALTELGILLVR